MYRIGSLRNSDAKLITSKPFFWTNGPIKILGIEIDYDAESMNVLNLEQLLAKSKTVLDLWHHRGLTLVGKVLVVNALCASLFIYRLNVLQSIPANYIKQFNQILRDFIWNGGRAKIAMDKMFNVKEYGGLKLINLSIKDYALKCQWVAKIKESPTLKTLSE